MEKNLQPCSYFNKMSEKDELRRRKFSTFNVDAKQSHKKHQSK